MTVLVIEHNLEELSRLTPRMYVMDRGRVSPKERRVTFCAATTSGSYMGRDMSATPYNANIPTHVAPADERLLRLKNLSVAMVIPTSSAASICTSVLARLLLSQAPTAQESQPSSKPLCLLPRLSGEAYFRLVDLTKTGTEDRISHGISYVPQVHNVFGSLTVQENLQVVERVADKRKRIQDMYDLFPALAARRGTYACNLSGGERQQLAFARALMPSPALMLLDEPSAALSPALTNQVFDEVRRLPAMDVAVLMVEQRARQALAFSDRGYIWTRAGSCSRIPVPASRQ